MAEERWRPVPGYVGFYEISDRGRVRSLDRVIVRRDGAKYPVRGRILRPSRHPPSWVVTVSLARCGHKRDRCVHKLVQQAFGTTEEAA
jgi:NUMOD4 motif